MEQEEKQPEVNVEINTQQPEPETTEVIVPVPVPDTSGLEERINAVDARVTELNDRMATLAALDHSHEQYVTSDDVVIAIEAAVENAVEDISATPDEVETVSVEENVQPAEKTEEKKRNRRQLWK